MNDCPRIWAPCRRSAPGGSSLLGANVDAGRSGDDAQRMASALIAPYGMARPLVWANAKTCRAIEDYLAHRLVARHDAILANFHVARDERGVVMARLARVVNLTRSEFGSLC